MNPLRKLIDDLALTQVQFARSLRYTNQYISDLVNGRQPVTAAFIGRLSVVYGMEKASTLVPYIGERLPQQAQISTVL